MLVEAGLQLSGACGIPKATKYDGLGVFDENGRNLGTKWSLKDPQGGWPAAFDENGRNLGTKWRLPGIQSFWETNSTLHSQLSDDLKGGWFPPTYPSQAAEMARIPPQPSQGLLLLRVLRSPW